jgi:hypothetical protein
MSYSFLKESKLFIVYGGNKYRIYTDTALSFTQTFAEDSYSVKTLHDQTKMIEGTNITKANPAQFSFSTPLTVEKDESLVMDLLSDLVSTSVAEIDTQQLKAFDIYVQTGSSTFKIDSCVVTSGNFAFNPRAQFTVAIEGQGTKLSRAGDESYTIPGSLQPESSTRTPLQVYPEVSVDSLNMSNILTASIQIQNDIQWNPFDTLHESLAVTNSSNAMFPSTYTVEKRTVSGAIQQYQTDNNITQFDDFSSNSTISITAKTMQGTSFWKIELNPAMYTARMDAGDVYTQTYDFRSTSNTAIGTQITQYS